MFEVVLCAEAGEELMSPDERRNTPKAKPWGLQRRGGAMRKAMLDPPPWGGPTQRGPYSASRIFPFPLPKKVFPSSSSARSARKEYREVPRVLPLPPLPCPLPLRCRRRWTQGTPKKGARQAAGETDPEGPARDSLGLLRTSRCRCRFRLLLCPPPPHVGAGLALDWGGARSAGRGWHAPGTMGRHRVALMGPAPAGAVP